MYIIEFVPKGTFITEYRAYDTRKGYIENLLFHLGDALISEEVFRKNYCSGPNWVTDQNYWTIKCKNINQWGEVSL